MRVLWTKRAVRQRKKIVDYILEQNPAAAQAVEDAIYERAGDLVHHSKLGRPGRILGTRELVLTNLPYVLAYRVKSNRVEILAVLHAARRWPARFR